MSAPAHRGFLGRGRSSSAGRRQWVPQCDCGWRHDGYYQRPAAQRAVDRHLEQTTRSGDATRATGDQYGRMPTFTSTAVRTRTGTEIHAAPEGFSRTYCGCRVYSRLSRADLMAAQAAGQLCDKCWRGAAQTETPAEWQARCDRVDAEYLAAEAAELDAETAEGKCPTCGHAAHGANSWCMAGTEAPRFAGERAAELEAPAAESLTHRAYRLIDELDEACADCADLKIRNAGLADLDAARAYYHQCAYGHAVKRAAHGLGRFIVPVPCEEPSEYQTGVVEVDGRDVGEGLSRFR